ncbi:hypothetical protein KQY30_19950 [Streptomyces sp. GMY02]|uniref:hypothetical protein n=1 Tax=Streptomyces sp. GMY02 TaxID=1333528 RepID=UPI001C2BBEE3|nr:hypothetical protein [Streptomyces sp. GMY02]QXE36175.1 hypothetical protein KQY30_19950 [Streptomyces sp. GMY02]
MNEKLNEVTSVTFSLGPGANISAGRACRLTEQDAAITVRIRYGHAHPGLCRDLNDFHRQILGVENRWAQAWDPSDPGRVDSAPKGLGMADVQWRIVPASKLPAAATCLPLEEQGRFVWMIRMGFATPQLITEMNEYLARITGDGLWVQRWSDRPDTH